MLLMTLCSIRVLVFAEATPSYPSLIVAGTNSLNQGYLASALDLFQSALDIDPKGVEARYYIGVIHAQSGRWNEAADAFRKALAADRTYLPAYFDMGVLYFQIHQDDKALAAFQVVEKIDPDRARVPYYQGLILRRNGKSGEAAKRFEAAASLERGLAAEAGYRAGEAYYASGDSASAQRAFKNVSARYPGSDAARLANEFLENIAESTLALSLATGIQFDSNVVLEPSQGPVSSQTGRDKADLSGVVHLRGNYRWLDTPLWLGRLQYSFYENLHTKGDLNDFNIQDHHLNLEGGRKFGGSELTLQYELQFTSIGGSEYLTKNSEGVRYLIQESKLHLTELTYWYGHPVFHNVTLFPNNSDRDAHSHQLGATRYWMFDGDGNLHGGYLFENNQAGDSPAEDDWSFDGHHLTLGALFPPWKGLVLSADMEYIIRRFSEPNQLSSGVKREDDGPIFVVSLLRSYGSHFDLSLHYLYQQNNSNIPLYDYQRAIYGLTGTGRF